MNKKEMSIVVMSALLNISTEKAGKLAEKNHGEFLNLMKNKKSHLEEMYIQAVNINMGRENDKKKIL